MCRNVNLLVRFDHMRRKSYMLMVFGILLAVFTDQLTKCLVVRSMEVGDSIPLIKDVFEIHYIQNSGMAWGMFSGRTSILAILSVIMVLALLYVYHNIIDGRYYRPLRVLIIFIIGGAVGNLIDRFMLGYVVDFLYFKLINFPVFNVADIYVTMGVILLVLLMLIKYKGKDLDVLLGDGIRLEDGSYKEKKRKKKGAAAEVEATAEVTKEAEEAAKEETEVKTEEKSVE